MVRGDVAAGCRVAVKHRAGVGSGGVAGVNTGVGVRARVW